MPASQVASNVILHQHNQHAAESDLEEGQDNSGSVVSCSERVAQQHGELHPTVAPDEHFCPKAALILDTALENLTIPPHISVAKAARHSLPVFPECDINSTQPAPLIRPEASEALRSLCPGLTKIYDVVRDSGRPNYRGARIPVIHGLNIAAWKKYAHIISDVSLIPMLEFGFPAGYEAPYAPILVSTNHSSAEAFPQHVQKYMDTELHHGALIGPFNDVPFHQWFRCSPLMTRPKKDSEDRRVILDLSFPDPFSVNGAIPTGSLDHATFKLRLPTPQDLANKMLELGPGCMMYKIDLSRAYRQLRSDPLDWPLLGINWQEDYYIDTAIPFGLRHGASACQRTSEAVVEIAADQHGAWTRPYVDDTIGAAIPQEAMMHYTGVRGVMDELGLDAADAKCCPPDVVMHWIGVTFNSLLMSMKIDQSKIDEAVQFCAWFLTRQYVSRKDMQKFMGKVLHATKCTEVARRFTSRLLDLLRTTGEAPTTPVGDEARLDALWLTHFLSQFNGITLIKPTVAQRVAFVDACLEGAGGHSPGSGLYKYEFPPSITTCQFSISALECFNILVGVRLWISSWQGSTVLLYSDNWAAVCAANSGRAQDPLIRASIRELWLLCAIKDVNLTIRHRPGESMQVADALSRATLSARHQRRVQALIAEADDLLLPVTHDVLAPPLFL